jgi:tRNA G18 (ribose-2'-O)-methylase SpoU
VSGTVSDESGVLPRVSVLVKGTNKDRESNKIPLFLLLDQLSDVRNFGAIIRNAACTSDNGIIMS